MLTVSGDGTRPGGRVGEGETSRSNHFVTVLRAGFSACRMHTKRGTWGYRKAGNVLCRV